LNGQGYASAELDAALKRMETTLDPAVRRTAASDVQRILAQDLPAVPLLSMVSIAAKTRRLKNFTTNPTNMTDFSGIARWYLEPPADGAP
jgi:peptide/nickel transport system substrate-binding protein